MGIITIPHLLHEAGHAAHILVTRVGAGPYQTVLHLQRPAVGLGGSAQLRDGSGEVGSEGAVNVRLQSTQVNLHHLVVLAVGVRAEQGTLVLTGLVCNGKLV